MKICLTGIAMLLFVSAYGQKRKNYFPVWTFHQRNINIYGMSVGLGSLRNEPRRTNTNGVKLEVPGVGLLVLFIPESPVAQDNSAFQQVQKDTLSERVNGLSLSALGTACDCTVNGISIGSLGQIQYKVNGLSFSLFNYTQIHRGIQLAMRNETHQMRGLQMGLLNHSKSTRGIQIGFWNTNERRSLPFINWNFRK